VQLDSIKTTLTAPGTLLLKLKQDKPLSIFDLKYNLRRYTAGADVFATVAISFSAMNPPLDFQAGTYTRPLSAHRKHLFGDTLGDFRGTVTNTVSGCELRSGRV